MKQWRRYQIDSFAEKINPGWLDFLDTCERSAGLDTLPNDLSRMLYLACLRDCNSGRYLHPQLSHAVGIEKAHQALSACHDRVFQRLLTTPVSQYVDQLEQYIRYTRAEKGAVVATWQSIEAYRATVPARAIAIYRDLFCLNVEIALLILNDPAALSGASVSDTRSQLRLV